MEGYIVGNNNSLQQPTQVQTQDGPLEAQMVREEERLQLGNNNSLQ